MCVTPNPAVTNMASSSKEASSWQADQTKMDKVLKLLSSPSMRRKAAAASHTPQPSPPVKGSYFGIPLEDLAERESRDVPFLITKVCDFLYNNGLDHEGIFRVSGSARVVEQLRGEFDRFRDADLSLTDDIFAVAGLLKLFMRELPDGIIPQDMTPQFVAAQEEYSNDKDRCIQALGDLLKKLPRIHYNTLKYLCRFLVLVSKEEEKNKMSPVALGIVFGPGMFRCADGTLGLREQGVTNHIAVKFIVHYDSLFLNANEMSPYNPAFIPDLKKGRVPPPRPPPPKIDDSGPYPSPRKHRVRMQEIASMDAPRTAVTNKEAGDTDSTSNVTMPCSRAMTPQHSDQEEFIDTGRAYSPIPLDSARSESTALDSLNTLEHVNTQVVERVITSTVSEHLFGDSTHSISSDDSKTDQYTGGPIPAPRRKHKKRGQESASDSCSESSTADERPGVDENVLLPVREKVKKLEIDEETADLRGKISPVKEKKKRPTSKAFQLFEEQGIIIKTDGPARTLPSHSQAADVYIDCPGVNGHDPSQHPTPPPRSPKKEFRQPVTDHDISAVESDDSGFGTIHRNHTPLTNFKRPAGPKNRRSPTRNKMSPVNTLNTSDASHKNESKSENTADKVPLCPTQDENHNEAAPSISFLELHHKGGREDPSPERSPSTSRKPYIPPLDLSILHENIDGCEPITAQQGMSVSLHKAKPYQEDVDRAMLSPRTAKLKQKKRENANTDFPPSPPTEQTMFPSGKREDEQNAQIKQLTKRIQSYKRKIKAFEEEFERIHGYRPSQTDKAARPEIKKYVQELAKARKELRTVTLPPRSPLVTTDSFSFDSDVTSASRAYSLPAEVKDEYDSQRLGYVSSGSVGTPGSEPLSSPDQEPAKTPLPQDTLNILLERLRQKRYTEARPEDLSAMTREQIQQEKTDIQKSLLQFEGEHGRPSTKAEKELMKPLYDRYRNIKRLLAKPTSPREKLCELEAVPEDSPVDFTPTSFSSLYTEEAVNGSGAGEDSFLVTRDLCLLQNTVKPSSLPVTSSHSPTEDAIHPDTRMHPDADKENTSFSPENSPARNLHELSISQLLEEQHSAKTDKKRLRKCLREFEEDFLRQTGRKVQKDDRAPMDAEYLEYKQVKAKLKLLDALLSKHSAVGST